MKRHGYTLVELLVVVTVAGILAALLLPAFAQSGQENEQENEHRAQCQSHLKQMSIGIMMYVRDFDEMYPPAAANTSWLNRPRYGWVDLVDPYLRNIELFQCPSDKNAAGNDPSGAGYTDYWFNRNLASLSLAALPDLARTLQNGDGDGGSTASNARYAINSLPRTWVDTYGSPARRHLDGGNYAFTDGHVKWVKPQGITTAKHSAAVGATFSIE
jgi:prepilin-type N-terminal cleavage/methylation domain-containing protein/prepilin-type processing-associated H-X9-DG protein